MSLSIEDGIDAVSQYVRTPPGVEPSDFTKGLICALVVLARVRDDSRIYVDPAALDYKAILMAGITAPEGVRAS